MVIETVSENVLHVPIQLWGCNKKILSANLTSDDLWTRDNTILASGFFALSKEICHENSIFEAGRPNKRKLEIEISDEKSPPGVR
jgi:hypothetical protein